MSKKMTKREMFEQIKAKYSLTDDEKAFIDHELELLAKKNASEKKPTAKQTENETIKANILDAMEPNRLYTISELLKVVPGLPEDFTNQRMSALVRQMLGSSINRVEEKRKAYFQKITD
jgi:hypothetical protein